MLMNVVGINPIPLRYKIKHCRSNKLYSKNMNSAHLKCKKQKLINFLWYIIKESISSYDCLAKMIVIITFFIFFSNWMACKTCPGHLIKNDCVRKNKSRYQWIRANWITVSISTLTDKLTPISHTFFSQRPPIVSFHESVVSSNLYYRRYHCTIVQG